MTSNRVKENSSMHRFISSIVYLFNAAILITASFPAYAQADGDMGAPRWSPCERSVVGNRWPASCHIFLHDELSRRLLTGHGSLDIAVGAKGTTDTTNVRITYSYDTCLRYLPSTMCTLSSYFSYLGSVANITIYAVEWHEGTGIEPLRIEVLVAQGTIEVPAISPWYGEGSIEIALPRNGLYIARLADSTTIMETSPGLPDALYLQGESLEAYGGSSGEFFVP